MAFIYNTRRGVVACTTGFVVAIASLCNAHQWLIVVVIITLFY